MISGFHDLPMTQKKIIVDIWERHTNKILFRLPDIAQMIQEISHFEV